MPQLGSEERPVLMTNKKTKGRRVGVYVGGKTYKDNWEKIFGNKKKRYKTRTQQLLIILSEDCSSTNRKTKRQHIVNKSSTNRQTHRKTIYSH